MGVVMSEEEVLNKYNNKNTNDKINCYIKNIERKGLVGSLKYTKYLLISEFAENVIKNNSNNIYHQIQIDEEESVYIKKILFDNIDFLIEYMRKSGEYYPSQLYKLYLDCFYSDLDDNEKRFMKGGFRYSMGFDYSKERIVK